MLSIVQMRDDLTHSLINFNPTDLATHPGCSSPAPADRLVHLRGADLHNLDSVTAVDDLACPSCGREGTVTTEFASIVEALGAPPPGSDVTAADVEAEVLAFLTQARAEMVNEEAPDA